MWDKEKNHNLFTVSASSATDVLISYLVEFHLTMTLPKGLPTLKAMHMKKWTRINNVFMLEGLAELLTCCDTAPGLRGPGMDHIPIHTIINTGIPPTTLEPYRNYKMVDWKAFREELAQQLVQIPEPAVLCDDTQFQNAVASLTEAIQATNNIVVPLSKLVPHSRLGLSTSTSTFMGTCGFIRGKTCTNRSPVCRYLALKLPTSTGDDFGIVDLLVSTRAQLGARLGARLSCRLKFATRHPAPCHSTGSSPRSSRQPRTPL